MLLTFPSNFCNNFSRNEQCSYKLLGSNGFHKLLGFYVQYVLRIAEFVDALKNHVYYLLLLLTLHGEFSYGSMIV